jgi:type II secretory pathway pseudopilin PulG
MQTKTRKNAFTLVEVLFAVILVGFAIAALLTANSAFTIANGAGADLSTAEFLIEQIRELTAMMSYNSLSTLDEQSYSPPIDADGQVLNNFVEWSQRIIVENVSISNFEQVVPDGSSDFVRITVRVFLNSKQISSACWIRAGY